MAIQGDSQPLPIGLYESLISSQLEEALNRGLAHGLLSERTDLDDADSPEVLARYFKDLLENQLHSVKPSGRIAIVNSIIGALNAAVPEAAAREEITTSGLPLLQLVTSNQGGLAVWRPGRPAIPLASSDLLMNNRKGPSMQRAVTTEIESADRISMIVSFIMWSGVRLFLPALRAAIERGAEVKVLTTTYMGATEPKALDALVSVGAQVRINYDTQGTRLHAKGWLFERNTGLNTAYVGSSNMSYAAMSAGQEWNVRLSSAETPHLVRKFDAVFSSHWQNRDSGFEEYDPIARPTDRQRLEAGLAISGARRSAMDTDESLPFDLTPRHYQTEMLEDLEREREVYGRFKNLVVAATGTGKTMVAAFDYQRVAADGRFSRTNLRFPTLLYVAHREEILVQARRAFRHVLRLPDFGELLVGGITPKANSHVFASIQSLTGSDRLAALHHEYYDFVIVDEFHHAGAKTWTDFLSAVSPNILLGLTATPERLDGIDVVDWFDGHIATEIRLWEALERDLLVPFHYFAAGSHDLDFSQLKWTGSGYSKEDLDRVLTGNDVVMRLVLGEIFDKVTAPRTMKALVFAAGVEHAHYVADKLTQHGVASVSLHGDSPKAERRAALRRLKAGEIQAIVTVDLFNEGVDIPEVDTVILLRPTESQTVFLQQLGRGLRRTVGKEVLTVLDFVGLQNKKFRYDLRFRALTGVSRRDLPDAIASGFPYLPSGSSIQLDSVASDLVLQNIKESLPSTKPRLVQEIKDFATSSSATEIRLSSYLETVGRELTDVYSQRGRSWTELLREAGLTELPKGPQESLLLRTIAGLLHVDDKTRIGTYRRLLTDAHYANGIDFAGVAEKRLAAMLYFSLWKGEVASWAPTTGARLAESFASLRANAAVVDEVLQVLDLAEQSIPHVTHPLTGALHSVPLQVHARYNRAEMLAGIGWAHVGRTPRGQAAGVRRVDEIRADVFDVTWQKSEKQYSPNTMYRDYAISPTLIHWESQNEDRSDSAKIQRYISHANRGEHVLFFARESKFGPFGTRPYMFLGPARYVSHSGDRPVSFVWELERPLPAEFFVASELLAG